MTAYTELFKALASEDRLRLVFLLSHHAFCVCELERIINRSQVNVSRDLKILKQAGIIDSRKQAQFSVHFLSPDILENFPHLSGMLKELSQREPFMSDFYKARPFMEESLASCAIRRREEK